MSGTPKSPHTARSRAPLDEAGATWWEIYGSGIQKPDGDLQPTKESAEAVVNTKMPTGKAKLHKATNTESKLKSDTYKNVVGKSVYSEDIKEKVLTRWREEQAKMRYEVARKALINSLKLKFSAQESSKPPIENRIQKSNVTYSKYDKTTEKILNQNTYDALAQTKINLASHTQKIQHAKTPPISLEASCHANSIGKSGHELRPAGENRLTPQSDSVQNPSMSYDTSLSMSSHDEFDLIAPVNRGEAAAGVVRSSSEGACHARSLLEPGRTVAQRQHSPVRGDAAGGVRDWLPREHNMPVRFSSCRTNCYFENGSIRASPLK